MIPVFDTSEFLFWVMTRYRKQRLMKEGYENNGDYHLLYCQLCHKLLKIKNEVITYKDNNFHWNCFRKAVKSRLIELFDWKIAMLERQLEAFKRPSIIKAS